MAQIPVQLRRFQLPWLLLILLAIALIATGVDPKSSQSMGDNAAPVVQQPAVPVVQNPQVNTAPKVSAPVAPKVVDYRVTWTEVKGFDPSTTPVEDGFYKGAITYNTSSGINPNDPMDIPEMTAYAWRILPQLEGERALWNKSINLAAARDQSNKDVVLVSITADRNPPYILLSVDGEQSWCMLNLLWDGIPYGDATRTRVVVTGDKIHLYGQHPLGPRTDLYWWTATVKKSELPCS